MKNRGNAYRIFGNILMYGVFLVALLTSVVTVCIMLSSQNWEGVGVGVSATGVWIALWFFVSGDISRSNDVTEVRKGLHKIKRRLKKCECKCQADMLG